MSDLNDFYVFKMTTTGSGSSGGKYNNKSGGNGDGTGCSMVLIALGVIGWVLWFIGRFVV